MSASTLALWFTLVPFVFGAAAVFARRAGGRRLLAVVWAAGAALLLVIGWIDWTRPPDEGTPFAAYVVFAIVPTAVAAYVADRTSRGDMPTLMRVLAAGTLGWLSILAVVGLTSAIIAAR